MSTFGGNVNLQLYIYIYIITFSYSLNNNMKKIFSAFTAVAIFFSAISLAQAIPLKDVWEGDQFTPAIKNLYEMGVINGYPDGTFRPEGDLNRAELLKIVMLSAKIEPTGQLKNCFPDVGEEWFAEYVCMAKERGWIEGYADGTYKPAQIVNRVEALKMLLEVFNVELIEPGYQQYGDVDMEAWYATYLATAMSWQMLESTQEQLNYQPEGAMKRGVFSFYTDNLLKEEANRFQSAFEGWVCEAYGKGDYDIYETPFEEVEPILDAELIKKGFKVNDMQFKEELGRRHTVKLDGLLTADFDPMSYCK